MSIIGLLLGAGGAYMYFRGDGSDGTNVNDMSDDEIADRDFINGLIGNANDALELYAQTSGAVEALAESNSELQGELARLQALDLDGYVEGSVNDALQVDNDALTARVAELENELAISEALADARLSELITKDAEIANLNTTIADLGSDPADVTVIADLNLEVTQLTAAVSAKDVEIGTLTERIDELLEVGYSDTHLVVRPSMTHISPRGGLADDLATGLISSTQLPLIDLASGIYPVLQRAGRGPTAFESVKHQIPNNSRPASDFPSAPEPISIEMKCNDAYERPWESSNGLFLGYEMTVNSKNGDQRTAPGFLIHFTQDTQLQTFKANLIASAPRRDLNGSSNTLHDWNAGSSVTMKWLRDDVLFVVGSPVWADAWETQAVGVYLASKVECYPSVRSISMVKNLLFGQYQKFYHSSRISNVFTRENNHATQ